jgi:hypothetical protein
MLCGGLTIEVAFDALERISVRTIGETELASWNALETSVVLAGDQRHAVAVVTELVREYPSSYLTAADVWRLLEPRGYTPNPWRSSRSLVEKVLAANERFIASRQRTLIGRTLIRRPEADRLRELVDARPLVVVDGAAGTGKSDVLLQFIQDLGNAGVPFLAFRLDRATPHPAVGSPRRRTRASGIARGRPRCLRTTRARGARHRPTRHRQHDVRAQP